VRLRIEINPIRCDAHGLCAELLPEHVGLDEWGYPLLDDAPVDPALEDLARRAADACPTLALKLRSVRPVSVSPGGELRDQYDRQDQPQGERARH
jgi:ferredoxin